MSAAERQQQFETAVRALPGIRADARVARNFGWSNSARVIEGGLFACTNNMEAYSAGLAAGTTPPLSQFIFLCVLTFPPQDEVYFAVVVDDAERVNAGLLKLFAEGTSRNEAAVAAGKKAGSISNNVKFYITDRGELLFHNHDFHESLAGGTLAVNDCVASVSAIHFAIWPPAISARRSMLAREFVGYLGTLMGRDKVHEMVVWDVALAASEKMRRMPASVDIAEIEGAIAAAGGHYPHGEVRRLHGSLSFHPDKHFVILAGLSGTGKTQLAVQYARAVHGVADRRSPDPFLIVCPVRPDWTDPTGLTGYYDVLSNRYVVPPFLEAVLLATAHRDSPVFVVLDELNLARVEYYLSDVLSSMETGEPLRLHAMGVPLEGSTGTSIPAEIPIPPNLHVIGTINVDETTNPVSDKVLDRAMVIDMSEVDLAGYIGQLSRESSLAASASSFGGRLVAVHTQMGRHGRAFGYRVASEAIRYHAFMTGRVGMNGDGVADDLMVQKILVKLRGAEPQRAMLTGLAGLLAGMPRSQAMLSRLVSELDEFGSFQSSR